MAGKDFGVNLRLLCSYGKSISAICRQAGINRHQLQRYLNGSSEPSLHTLRRLCDFFGLEEHEMLLPHRDFAMLVRVRPPRLQRTRDRVSEYMAAHIDSQDLAVLVHYEGYYHAYSQPNRRVPEIHRTLTRISIEDRCLITKTLERFPAGLAGLPRVVRYAGIAYRSGNALTVIERRPSAPESQFFTILYGADSDELTFMTGLVMGVSPDSTREIYCLRTCWQYLGKEVDLRRRIRECGQFARDDRVISRHIRYCTQNDLAAGDETFSPHF
ncbi:MAG: helix-turn-helix domain-containing protein [Dongiaceae bacterium]